MDKLIVKIEKLPYTEEEITEHPRILDGLYTASFENYDYRGCMVTAPDPETAFRELMISLQLKILYDSGLNGFGTSVILTR